MSFDFACRSCGTLVRATEQLVGKRAKCPGCQAVIVVPDPDAVVEPELETLESAPLPSLTPNPAARSAFDDTLPAQQSAAIPNTDLIDADPLSSKPTSRAPVSSNPSWETGGRGLATQPDLTQLAFLNWPVIFLSFMFVLCLITSRTGVLEFQGGAANLGAIWLGLAGIGFLLTAYGVAARNFGNHEIVSWTEANLGKIVIGIGVVASVINTIVALVKTPTLMSMGTLAVGWVIAALVWVGMWKLYESFGFFKVAAWCFTLLVTIGLLITFPLRSIANNGFVTLPAGVPGTQDAAADTLSKFNDVTFEFPRASSLTASQLPDVPEFRQIVDGVEFAEVRLTIEPDQPGTNNRLFLYRPAGLAPDALCPCVFIAAAGAAPLTGKRLEEGDRAEHIPYVQAGFAVVAYEIDGQLPDASYLDSNELSSAVQEFCAAGGGVLNGLNAIEYANRRLEFADPAQSFSVGHSSAGSAALMLAAHYPLLRGSVAYAASSNLTQSLDRATRNVYKNSVPLCESRLEIFSPIRHVESFRCPVHLFHTQDDGVVSAQESMRLASALREVGREVEEFFPDGDDHYGDMIGRGIPNAIRWLKSQVRGRTRLAANPKAQRRTGEANDVDAYALASKDGGAQAQPTPPSAEPDGNFEQLLERIEGGEHPDCDDALATLHRVLCDDVQSRRTRKRIAIVYKKLAFEPGSIDDRTLGIKGMVKWGGKHSVPLLLTLLDDRLVCQEVLKVLGKLQDPRAAMPVAEKLADLSEREAAYHCLKEMGAAAEDVVIEIVPSTNPEISMAAINLLADIGSQKSLSILRKAAAKGRHAELRQRAKEAITQVRQRMANKQ